MALFGQHRKPSRKQSRPLSAAHDRNDEQRYGYYRSGSMLVSAYGWAIGGSVTGLEPLRLLQCLADRAFYTH